MRLATCTVVLALAAALPYGAAAQWRPAADAPPHVWTAGGASPETALPPPPLVQDERAQRQGAMLGGGLVGGALGGVLGFGWGIARNDLGSTYFGTVVGVGAGMAYGVHRANRKQGSLALGMLASVGWSVLLAGFALETESVPLLAAAPLGSLLFSMMVEERTSSQR